ncbi:MAG: ABC transporter permease [Cyclobacteriaceae bacterium]
MLRNYFRVAIRSLLRHKFYSILNILGLTIGMVCFMMISLFVLDELSYDQFHKDANRIFRVDFMAQLNGEAIESSNTGAPTAKALKEDYPEVEDATRLNATGNWFIKEKGTTKTFKEEHVLMADPNIFDFFTVELIYGDPKTCLERPNTLVMDRTTAQKMFGDVNPVGKILVLDNEDDYEVTGVYEDLPDNSHFHQNILLSMITFYQPWQNDAWLSTNYNTYIKLQEGVTKADFEPKFTEVIEKYCAPLIMRYLNMNLEEFGSSGNQLAFSLFPMKDIHLKSHKQDELEANGDIKYVYIFSAVALFILVLACINFMNLATARSANRAKEVGIRKVMGAFRKQLVSQFISEAVMLTFISCVLSFIIAALLLPNFGELAAKSFAIGELIRWEFVALMAGLVLVVGLFAGSYPAFYLSAFRPAQVLKGKVRQGMKSGPIRSALVVFQFSISIIMIIGTAVVFDQLAFIQNKKLGFEKDQILMVNDAWILRDKAESFKNEVMRSSNIEDATLATFTPVSNVGNSDVHHKDPVATASNSIVINQAWVDYNYLDVMGMEMADGRFFSRDFGGDSTVCVLNEAAVKAFGYENAIGDKLYHAEDGPDGELIMEGNTIVGVVKDFHYASLKEKIGPLVIRLGRGNGFALFKLKGQDVKSTVETISNTWDEFAPGQPFSYTFMNQRFNSMYEAEQKVGEIFTVFAVLAIFIACLGLFGLAAFTAEQKTKEIGIRKALGASIASIVTLLSKNFIKLVLISFAISIPVSYFTMKEWLNDFAYRTDIKPLTFVIAGVVALVVAWVTMSFQSWKAARVNPVKSLRDE